MSMGKRGNREKGKECRFRDLKLLVTVQKIGVFFKGLPDCGRSAKQPSVLILL